MKNKRPREVSWGSHTRIYARSSHEGEHGCFVLLGLSYLA